MCELLGDAMSERPHVLVIAGTDSSGGAGLIRDVQVISAFGARATCAVTAVTAQTHTEVVTTFGLPADVVRRQMRAALRSGPIGTIKIGMLGSAAIVRAVIEELPERSQIPIIVDPVLCSSSGASLLDAEGIVLLRDYLFARSTLITPNLIEAATLLGGDAARAAHHQVEQTAKYCVMPGANEDTAQAGRNENGPVEHTVSGVVDRVALAEGLLKFGSEFVLLKGGHARGEDAIDVLASRSASPIVLSAPRVNANLRGTGCGLSSAIAALLATGGDMKSACERAKNFIHMELLAAAAV